MIEIRLLEPEEFDDCYALILEASAWLKEKGVSQWETPISREQFESAHLKGEVFVFLIDQKIAGSVTLSDHKDFYWGEAPGSGLHLHRLVVAREFKGQGIGERLLTFAWEEAKRRGFDFLRLDCRNSNAHLKRYYSGNSFDYKGVGQGHEFEYALFERATFKPSLIST